MFILSTIDEFECGETGGIRLSGGPRTPDPEYSDLYDLNYLHEDFRQARRESCWKAPVQCFDWYELYYIYLMHTDIKEHRYKPDPTYNFGISERGKPRDIKANTIKDRVMNTVIENRVLLPVTEPKLIIDNGASREGMGTDHARERLKKHLHDAMINYGPEATIVVMDFHDFFGSIIIPLLFRLYDRLLDDKQVMEAVKTQFCAHNTSDVGVGIGSILSQNAGIFYPYWLDNYIKIVLGRKYYARYMDDSYIICRNKAEAHDLYRKVKAYAKRYLGLEMNDNKRQICNLTHGFVFLKFRYHVTETGKVYMRQSGDTFKRERKRIKRWKNTEMTPEMIQNSYRSWRGSVARYPGNEQRIQRTDAVFKAHYPDLDFRKGKEIKNDLRQQGERTDGAPGLQQGSPGAE